MSDEKHKTPIDQYSKIEASPLPPMAPDGGFADGVGQPPPIPAFAVSVCVRGPCRHYWELETHMASGNPAETWDPVVGLKDVAGNPIRMPRQINRSCLAHPGTETEITEDCVYACNRWSPLTPKELKIRRRGEQEYYDNHPEHRTGAK